MSNPRNRNLLIIIAVLLLTNIAVLVYFLGAKKPAKSEASHKEKGIGDLLQKEVGFSEEQLAQYQLLKDQQREAIKPMYDDMRKIKDSLFRLLSYPEKQDSLVAGLTEAIAQKQRSLDLQTFNYFKKVRELCSPGQEAKYDSLILRTFRKIGKPPHSGDQEKSKQEQTDKQ